jgi:hypothetical protein
MSSSDRAPPKQGADQVYSLVARVRTQTIQFAFRIFPANHDFHEIEPTSLYRSYTPEVPGA